MKVLDLQKCLVRAAENLAADEGDEVRALADALSKHQESPTTSLYKKLQTIVVPIPKQRAPRKPASPKPKVSKEDRQAAIADHTQKLKGAFYDDGEFAQLIAATAKDPRINKDGALQLFSAVIGDVNFSSEGARKPAIIGQIKTQRQTIALRKHRIGED